MIITKQDIISNSDIEIANINLEIEVVEGKVIINDIEMLDDWWIYKGSYDIWSVDKNECYMDMSCGSCIHKEDCKRTKIDLNNLHDLDLDKAIPITDHHLGVKKDQERGIFAFYDFFSENKGYYFEDEDIWVSTDVFTALRLGLSLEQCENSIKQLESKKNKIIYFKNVTMGGRDHADQRVSDPQILEIKRYK